MSMFGIATHFLGSFSVCDFAFVIWCFFVNRVFFIMKSRKVYFSVTTEWQHCILRSRESNHKRAIIAGDRNSALKRH